jgi:DNA polymerase III subunit epsilon
MNLYYDPSEIGPPTLEEKKGDRNRAIDAARKLLMKSLTIFDTETTGLGKNDEIVEIAIIRYTPGEATSILLNQRIKPFKAIPADATSIHHISNEDVIDCPTFGEIASEVSKHLSSGIITGYNVEFDMRMVRQSANHYCCQCPVPSKQVCAMKIAAAYCGCWNHEHNDYRWPKLSQLVATADHSALADTLATLELLKKIASTGMSK